MEIMKAANLGLRFLLELCILGVFGFWGFQLSALTVVKIGLALGAPVLAAVVWGRLLAPHASERLQQPWLFVLEILIFGLAISALFAAGQPAWAAIFGTLYVINKLAMWLWHQ